MMLEVKEYTCSHCALKYQALSDMRLCNRCEEIKTQLMKKEHEGGLARYFIKGGRMKKPRYTIFKVKAVHRKQKEPIVDLFVYLSDAEERFKDRCSNGCYTKVTLIVMKLKETEEKTALKKYEVFKMKKKEEE